MLVADHLHLFVTRDVLEALLGFSASSSPSVFHTGINDLNFTRDEDPASIQSSKC